MIAVFTLSSGFGIDKYIAKFIDTDFVISTANCFRFQFGNSEFVWHGRFFAERHWQHLCLSFPKSGRFVPFA